MAELTLLIHSSSFLSSNTTSCGRCWFSFLASDPSSWAEMNQETAGTEKTFFRHNTQFHIRLR